MTTAGAAAPSLGGRLCELFGRGVQAPLSDSEFNEFARSVFEHQVSGSPTYASYCAARGVAPDTCERWDQIPAVPSRAFKVLDFNAHPEGRVDAQFKTSGTTRGAHARGKHVVADLALYRASLIPNFRAHLLPEGERLAMVALALSPQEAPDSSLSFMLGVVEEELVDSKGYFVASGSGLDVSRLEETVDELIQATRPVLIAGTAFTFVHWLDSMAERGHRLVLPEGSRIMETGGFKGRSRAVPRPQLYSAICDRLGVPDDHIVNEYGMTELLSQYYEPVLLGGPRFHVSPPWLRTRILDPATLAPLPHGEPGLIQHFDLANLNSVSAVLTEDIGTLTVEGLEHQGRASDAEPRGCSIAMDVLLSQSP